MDVVNYKLIENLKNGDFSNLEIDNWFLNYDFDYLFALIIGLSKNINKDILNLVVLYAKYSLNHINTNLSEEQIKYFFEKNNIHVNKNISYKDLLETWYCIVKNKLEKILEQIIIIGLSHHEYYGIVASLSTNSNEILRVFYCANGNFSPFLNDPSPRVRKVYHIREKYLLQWRKLSDVERAKVLFLENALNYGAIRALEIGVPSGDDKVNVTFKSLIFNEEITIEDFDWDILYAIQDKRILATKLYNIINERNIKFNEEMLPSFESSLGSRR